jgi:hypothetical protein
MKRTCLFARANQPRLLVGVILLWLCGAAIAPAGQQRGDDRRARAFVLEGIGAKYTDDYSSRGSVEVIRDGKKLELFPGDELREGDRVRRVKETADAIFSGASVAIYNSDGEPVLIVGHNQGVDFTLSRLRFDTHNFRAPKVEIINHFNHPPSVEMQIATQDSHGGRVDIYKADRSRERPLTAKEREFFEMQMGLYKPHRRYARWDRAGRIITEGRRGAGEEYSHDEAAYQAEDRRRDLEEERQRQAKAAEADRIANERKENNISLTGTWNSSVGYVYEISQTGSTFDWKITNNAAYNERAKGELKGKKIKATWTNRNGTDSAEGEVTIVDSEGRATLITWKNGVSFFRN